MKKILVKKISRASLHGLPEDEAFPNGAVRKFVFTPGFFRTIPVMPGAIEGIKQLMKNYQVYIVSAAMEFPQSLPEKYLWLQEHFHFVSWRHIIFCGDKSIIGTDYMLDDHLKNLDFFRGKGFLFTASHNAKLSHPNRFNNWSQVVDGFQKEAMH